MQQPEPPADAPGRGTSPRSSRPPATLHRRSHVVSILCTCVRTMLFASAVSLMLFRAVVATEFPLSHTSLFPIPFSFALTFSPAAAVAPSQALCPEELPVFPSDIKMSAHKDAQHIEKHLHHEMQSVRLHLSTCIPVFLITCFCKHFTETQLLTSNACRALVSWIVNCITLRSIVINLRTNEKKVRFVPCSSLL